PGNLARTFEQPEYLKWRAFRRMEDARFVGLTLPRVLRRRPYPDGAPRVDGFRFREEVEKPDRSQYLWGNAVYAFGAVLIRTFAQSGWLATLRGVPPGGEGRGRAGQGPADPRLRHRQGRGGAPVLDRRGHHRRPGQGAGGTGVPAAVPLPGHGVGRLPRQSVGAAARAVRRDGGDGERPAVGDAPLRVLRVAGSALLEGDQPRQAWVVRWAGRLRSVPASLAEPVYELQ